MKVRTFRALALLAVAATVALVPPGAQARSRCTSDLVVFSRSELNPIAFNSNALACMPGMIGPEGYALADGPADFRMLNPMSDTITVRYARDVKGKPSLIMVVLNGLGSSRYKTYAARTDVSIAGDGSEWGYDSPDLSIAPDAAGCLKVRAYSFKETKSGRMIKVLDETVTYHTYDALC